MSFFSITSSRRIVSHFLHSIACQRTRLAVHEGDKSLRVIRAGDEPIFAGGSCGAPERESRLVMVDRFNIGERVIGPDAPTYVIAELSANHNQSFDQPFALCTPPERLARTRQAANLYRRYHYLAQRQRMLSDKRYSLGWPHSSRTLSAGVYAMEWQPNWKKCRRTRNASVFERLR